MLALWAGYSLLGGNTFGRVIGYAWGVLVIVQSFMIISYAPWFGFGVAPGRHARDLRPLRVVGVEAVAEHDGLTHLERSARAVRAELLVSITAQG